MVGCDKCGGYFSRFEFESDKCPICGQTVRTIPEDEFKGMPEA